MQDPFLLILAKFRQMDNRGSMNAAVALVGGLVLLGILGWVGLNIMQQVSDTTALKKPYAQNYTGADTFYNASVEFTSAIELGFSWQKIIIIVIVAAVVITVLYNSGLMPRM